MLKLTVNEFIEEIKEEISCYEELGEQYSQKWEAKFKELLNSSKIKKSLLKGDMIVLKDEADLFSLVDNYWAAVYSNEEDKYWSGLQ